MKRTMKNCNAIRRLSKCKCQNYNNKMPSKQGKQNENYNNKMSCKQGKQNENYNNEMPSKQGKQNE